MRVLDERVNACRRMFDRYAEALADIDGLAFMPQAALSSPNRWLTVITLDPARCSVTPYQLMEALEAENIEARPVWKICNPCSKAAPTPPMPNMTASQSVCLLPGCVCRPGPNMSGDDQDRVIGCVRKTLGR